MSRRARRKFERAKPVEEGRGKGRQEKNEMGVTTEAVCLDSVENMEGVCARERVLEDRSTSK